MHQVRWRPRCGLVLIPPCVINKSSVGCNHYGHTKSLKKVVLPVGQKRIKPEDQQRPFITCHLTW